MISAHLSRSSDPLTSFQAADAAKEHIKTHELQILAVLRLHGPQGVDGIAAFSFLEPHAVGKRMCALKDNSLIELTGKTVKGDSGRNQREWKAV